MESLDVREVRSQPRKRFKASSKIHIFPTGQVDHDFPSECNTTILLLYGWSDACAEFESVRHHVAIASCSWCRRPSLQRFAEVNLFHCVKCSNERRPFAREGGCWSWMYRLRLPSPFCRSGSYVSLNKFFNNTVRPAVAPRLACPQFSGDPLSKGERRVFRTSRVRFVSPGVD